MEYLFATTEVPEKEDYYSALSDTHIDNETYEDIKRFWSIFKCDNLAQYSSYYVSPKSIFISKYFLFSVLYKVSLDTLLLAEVFNEFRQYILSWSNLDPDYYVGKFLNYHYKKKFLSLFIRSIYSHVAFIHT